MENSFGWWISKPHSKGHNEENNTSQNYKKRVRCLNRDFGIATEEILAQEAKDLVAKVEDGETNLQVEKRRNRVGGEMKEKCKEQQFVYNSQNRTPFRQSTPQKPEAVLQETKMEIQVAQKIWKMMRKIRSKRIIT